MGLLPRVSSETDHLDLLCLIILLSDCVDLFKCQ